jgi:ferric-dicitrate binding protein FerR (iron transport regulator)
MMNVASTLQVPVDYGSGNRTVRLTGQAAFTVTNQTGAPFIVNAGPSTTRVLGTMFTVRHYETDTGALVVVHDGKVSVGSQVLTRAQQVVVSRNGLGAIQSASPNALSQQQNVMTLESMSLGSAIPELSRWYDVDIRIADAALEHERISGRFRAGSIADLAEHLELAFNLRAVRTGNMLTLHSR